MAHELVDAEHELLEDAQSRLDGAQLGPEFYVTGHSCGLLICTDTKIWSRTSYVVRLHFLLGFLKTRPFFHFSVFAKIKKQNTFSENRVKNVIVNGTTYERLARVCHYKTVGQKKRQKKRQKMLDQCLL